MSYKEEYEKIKPKADKIGDGFRTTTELIYKINEVYGKLGIFLNGIVATKELMYTNVRRSTDSTSWKHKYLYVFNKKGFGEIYDSERDVHSRTLDSEEILKLLKNEAKIQAILVSLNGESKKYKRQRERLMAIMDAVSTVDIPEITFLSTREYSNTILEKDDLPEISSYNLNNADTLVKVDEHYDKYMQILTQRNKELNDQLDQAIEITNKLKEKLAIYDLMDKLGD